MVSMCILIQNAFSMTKSDTRTILIKTLLITSINATLLITCFIYFWFYLKLILLLAVNEKLASWIAGEESELCVLTSKDVISKVIIGIVVVPLELNIILKWNEMLVLKISHDLRFFELNILNSLCLTRKKHF